MPRILSITRPAIIVPEDVSALDQEYRAARWTHHRILDFEDIHSEVIDSAAEQCAPGIRRVGRIVSRLKRRVRRRERSTGWSPNPRVELRTQLEARLVALKTKRNTDPRWKAALKWGDTPAPDAPDRGSARKRASETDEAFDKRIASRRNKLTRREAHSQALYATRAVYWGTFNGLQKQVDQARSSVLKRRATGLPADLHRPRWDSPNTLYADKGGFRVERNGKRWTVLLRLHEGWVRFRLSSRGKLREDFTEFRTCKLTRRRDGMRWCYSVSLAVAGVPDVKHEGTGVVALDGGYREHGHPNEESGIRCFAFVGDDGRKGEVLLPAECRDLADCNARLLSELDIAFNKLAMPDRNRRRYRRRLLLNGVRTESEHDWLMREMRIDRRVAANRKRIESLRNDTYHREIIALRKHYSTFVLEDTTGPQLRRLATEEQTLRRKRQNRDMVAEYTFRLICERSGAEILTVPARNSTKECPSCGEVGESSSDLVLACPSCGFTRDQDFGAATVLLRRGIAALDEKVSKSC